MKRIRPSRLTFRARLALVYGGLVLLAGVLLLGITYALAFQRLADKVDMGPFTSGTLQPTAPPSSQGATPVPGGELQAHQSKEDTRRDALDALLTQGGIALAIVGAAAFAFGWLVAGRLLQPLHRMTETASRIANAPAADRSLHERIALRGPHDEVKQLADTFDVMLERLDQSFDGQRRFIANASHELRTPLTLNRALLEVAVNRKAATPEIRQLGETLMDINSRHGQLIDGLLLLARAENRVVERSYLDLADLVEYVVARTPSGAVTVHTEPGEAPTTSNPALLERLVQNLVENGIRHNIPNNGWVWVTSHTRSDGTAALVVSNTGPVVPPYEIPSLFEPFRRLGTERLAGPTGAGLGLSIVQAITRAHGGDVQAEPREAGGLTVTVTLPGWTDTARPDGQPRPTDDQR